jgi:hypothetical protein
MESELQSFLTLEQEFRVANYNRSIQNLSREELQSLLLKSYESFIKLDNYYKEIINAKMKKGLGI